MAIVSAYSVAVEVRFEVPGGGAKSLLVSMGVGGNVVRAGQSPAVLSMGASVDVGEGSSLGAFDRAVSSSVRCFRILALGGFLEPAGDREFAVL